MWPGKPGCVAIWLKTVAPVPPLSKLLLNQPVQATTLEPGQPGNGQGGQLGARFWVTIFGRGVDYWGVIRWSLCAPHWVGRTRPICTRVRRLDKWHSAQSFGLAVHQGTGGWASRAGGGRRLELMA